MKTDGIDVGEYGGNGNSPEENAKAQFRCSRNGGFGHRKMWLKSERERGRVTLCEHDAVNRPEKCDLFLRSLRTYTCNVYAKFILRRC